METMVNIYEGLLRNYESLEREEKELSEKKDKILEILEKYQQEFDLIDTRWEKLNKQKVAIKAAMEQLEQADFSLSEEEKKEEVVKITEPEPVKIEEEKPVEEEKKKGTVLEWKHKNAMIVQYGRNGGIIKKFFTQKEAAEALGFSATWVSKLLKTNEKAQIKKRGYYLRYEY